MAILGTIIQESLTALPEDRITNSFVIGGVGSSVTSGERDAITLALKDFLNTASGTMSSALRTWFNATRPATAGALQVKLYDITAHLDGSSHGPPFHTFSTTPIPGTLGTSLPDSVAVCVTLEAFDRANQSVETADGVDPGVLRDRPMQRHTGRVYLGPLNSTAISVDGTFKYATVNATLLDDARKAVDALADSVKAAATGAFLGVWSRVDQAVREVTVVSTDARFDTIRRRQQGPKSRTKLTVQTGSGVEIAA